MCLSGEGWVYFSLPVERKVPKERHLREAWRPPLRNPPSPRDPFAQVGAKGSDCAEGRGYPTARTNGGAPSARKSPEARRGKRNHVSHLREQAKPASSALRRGCGHPAAREVTAHWPFCQPAKRQRRTGDRIRKERTWALSLRGDSFGTFLSPRKEKYTDHSPDNPPIFLTAKYRSIRRCPR